MSYLLYLMFRCDKRCDGKFGKFRNFVATKHTLRRPWHGGEEESTATATGGDDTAASHCWRWLLPPCRRPLARRVPPRLRCQRPDEQSRSSRGPEAIHWIDQREHEARARLVRDFGWKVTIAHFIFIWQIMSNYKLIKFKRFISC